MKPDTSIVHRRAPRLVAAALLCVASAVAAPAFRASAISPPAAGTISIDGRLPNAADQADDALDRGAGTGDSFSVGTYLVADPARRLIIQAVLSAGAYDGRCPSSQQPSQAAYASQESAEWVAYDMDTFAPLQIGCRLPDLSVYGEQGSSGAAYFPVGTVDSRAGFVFVPCLQCGAILAASETAFAKGTTAICAATQGAETTEQGGVITVGQAPCTVPDGWPSSQLASASSLPDQYLHYLSWYSRTDDIVALTDNESADAGFTGPPGVAVTDYHVTVTSTGPALRLEWSVHLPGNVCGQALTGAANPGGQGQSWWSGAAYRSETPDDAAVFVPCTTPRYGTLAGVGLSTSVVRVPLNRPCEDAATDWCPSADPPTDDTAVTAPFPGQGFLFDPVGERGYLIPTTTDTGLSLAVYDGGPRTKGAFIARIAAGAPTHQDFTYSVDRQTGRVYVDDVGPGAYGLTVIDGRHNPPSVAAFPTITSSIGRGIGNAAAVLPPDAAHPYTRVLEPLYTDYNPHIGAAGRWYMKYFTVLADALPLSTDALPAQVDSNTFSGPLSPGADISVSYGTGAAGYGVHSLTVGGYGGLIRNNDPTGSSQFLAFQSERRPQDFTLGAVGSSALRDGVGEASASAAYDVNGNGQAEYHACSNVSSPQSCQPPLACAVGSQPPGQDLCSQAAAGGEALIPSGTSTAQNWPYPVAECTQPGTVPAQTVVGVNQTPPHSSSSDPSATPVPDQQVDGSATATGARAVVDCRQGAVTATGQYDCSGAFAPSTTSPSPSAPALPGGASSTPDADSYAPPSGCSQDEQPGSLTVKGARTVSLMTPPQANGGLAESQVTASVSGVHLDLGDGTVIDIGEISQSATAWAGGKLGTAVTSRKVVLSGITIQSSNLPQPVVVDASQQSLDPGALLDLLNSVDPSHLYVILPTPDEPFGVETDQVSPKGSPGGYQAVVHASAAQQEGDKDWNGMSGFGGAEKDFLPALRVVLFDPGDAQVNRQILDFAGVQADAELGLQVNPVDDTSSNTVDTTQAMIQAGYPPSSSFVPGTPGSPALPGQTAVSTAYPSGLLGVLERALTGLGVLVRSPLAALQMAGFLVLLGMPLALGRRRWTAGGLNVRGVVNR